MPNSTPRALAPAWSIALLLLAGCGASGSPEAQVRAVIAGIEHAAEARSASEVMEFIATDFHSDFAAGRDELAPYLRGYFLANPSIHLLTRVNRLEFPTPEEARAEITVARVGREADAAGAWNLAADLQDFRVVLRQQSGTWKVAHAAPFAPH